MRRKNILKKGMLANRMALSIIVISFCVLVITYFLANGSKELGEHWFYCAMFQALCMWLFVPFARATIWAAVPSLVQLRPELVSEKLYSMRILPNLVQGTAEGTWRGPAKPLKRSGASELGRPGRGAAMSALADARAVQPPPQAPPIAPPLPPPMRPGLARRYEDDDFDADVSYLSPRMPMLPLPTLPPLPKVKPRLLEEEDIDMPTPRVAEGEEDLVPAPLPLPPLPPPPPGSIDDRIVTLHVAPRKSASRDDLDADSVASSEQHLPPLPRLKGPAWGLPGFAPDEVEAEEAAAARGGATRSSYSSEEAEAARPPATTVFAARNEQLKELVDEARRLREVASSLPTSASAEERERLRVARRRIRQQASVLGQQLEKQVPQPPGPQPPPLPPPPTRTLQWSMGLPTKPIPEEPEMEEEAGSAAAPSGSVREHNTALRDDNEQLKQLVDEARRLRDYAQNLPSTATRAEREKAKAELRDARKAVKQRAEEIAKVNASIRPPAFIVAPVPDEAAPAMEAAARSTRTSMRTSSSAMRTTQTSSSTLGWAPARSPSGKRPRPKSRFQPPEPPTAPPALEAEAPEPTFVEAENVDLKDKNQALRDLVDEARRLRSLSHGVSAEEKERLRQLRRQMRQQATIL